jgi:hypothetical protein
MAALSTSFEHVRRAWGFQVLVVALGVLCLRSTTEGATLRVPQDYPTITAAANAAQESDSILVWPPPGGTEWENQQIMLRQGVTMRGMVDVFAFPRQMAIRDSDIHLLEGQSLQAIDDTTRVEHLYAGGGPFHETFQVFTPRSSIKECYIGSAGPQDWPAVRVWNGALIAGNSFGGSGESAFAARVSLRP